MSCVKKRLLKPPPTDGEILLIPDKKELLANINEKTKIGVAHQPYFFNPGISLKFLLLDYLPKGDKKILFLDIDRIDISVSVPSNEGLVFREMLLEEDKVLYNFPKPTEEKFQEFFQKIESSIKRTQYAKDILDNFILFKDIILGSRDGLLKDALVKSFLEYYKIEKEYQFVSDIVKSKEFYSFFERIYKEDTLFIKMFNQALDDYKKEFRFRYRNFPFPRLEDKELPFWVVRDDKREKCFKKDINLSDYEKLVIFPRASTLTIFLRLFYLDLLIHGTGAANYEWVNDRVIERFFNMSPPSYVVISGTFLIGDIKNREFPYFFFDPEDVRKSCKELLS